MQVYGAFRAPRTPIFKKATAFIALIFRAAKLDAFRRNYICASCINIEQRAYMAYWRKHIYNCRKSYKDLHVSF